MPSIQVVSCLDLVLFSNWSGVCQISYQSVNFNFVSFTWKALNWIEWLLVRTTNVKWLTMLKKRWKQQRIRWQNCGCIVYSKVTLVSEILGGKFSTLIVRFYGIYSFHSNFLDFFEFGTKTLNANFRLKNLTKDWKSSKWHWRRKKLTNSSIRLISIILATSSTTNS